MGDHIHPPCGHDVVVHVHMEGECGGSPRKGRGDEGNGPVCLRVFT